MRIFRILIFSLLNLFLFLLLKQQYELFYGYYFGEIVYIPELPMPYLYLPLLTFQVVYQLLLIFELFSKKFITKTLNYMFIVPIITIIVTFSSSPYDHFKAYPVPRFQVQELMFQVQTNLEAYRVKTKYYPKHLERFKEQILAHIPKKDFLSDYTIKTQKVNIPVFYAFDTNEAYLKNTKKYKAPAIVVHVSSSGKKYWITALIREGYLHGKDVMLSYNGKPFYLKDDVLIRERLRNKTTTKEMYKELIRSLKQND